MFEQVMFVLWSLLLIAVVGVTYWMTTLYIGAIYAG